MAAPLSITREREMVVDFSYPFYLEYTSVIVKRSDPKASKWRTLINPLKWEVLVTIGTVLQLIKITFFPIRSDPIRSVLNIDRTTNGDI